MLAEAIAAALQGAQDQLWDEAVAFRESHTADVSTLEAAVEAAQTGYARIPWDACGVEGEAKAAESAVFVRVLQREDGSVPDSLDESGLIAYLARQY
jgi:prolyl-tRNA synthetase